MKLISTIAPLLVLTAVLYLLISGNLLSWSPLVIAAQLAALATAIWARRTFRSSQFSVHAEPKDGALLRTGPYRYIRHPMYAAATFLIWAGILSHLTIVNVLIGVIQVAVMAVRIASEEAALRARFPDYPDYAKATKRLIPFIL